MNLFNLKSSKVFIKAEPILRRLLPGQVDIFIVRILIG